MTTHTQRVILIRLLHNKHAGFGSLAEFVKTVFQRAEKLFSENAKLKDGERELFIKLGGSAFY